MEKSSVLTALLIQDRIIRYNLNMLEMALKELRADIEELNFLAEVCLSKEEELKSYRQVIQKVEKDLFKSIDEVIEYLYDLYEVFNFEITFLANIPEELWREVERLDIPNSINSKMEEIANLLASTYYLCCINASKTFRRLYRKTAFAWVSVSYISSNSSFSIQAFVHNL